MTSTYADFLASKAVRVAHVGPDVDAGDVHTYLHPWQRELVAWAVRTGRAALWADTGLGKTLMQLEWARLSGDRVLIVAPLAVCHQTVREAAKIDLDARYLRTDDGQPGIVVTNYEISEHFDAAAFDAVVLDESSILKDVTSKTRDRLIEQFAVTPRRLACTATPAPNDAAELANHAEFLGVATRREMLSTYFVHDQDGWRPKGHARVPMYAWMATWAAAVRKPSDLGYPDDGYDLPALRIERHLVDVDLEREGEIIPLGLGGVTGRAQVRRLTLEDRCRTAADLVDASHDLAVVGSKLDPWDETPRTAKIGETPSTCAATTRQTGRSGCSPTSDAQSATSGDESATPPTPSIGSGPRPKPGVATRPSSATAVSVGSSASRPPSSTPGLPIRKGAARSAEARSGTRPGDALPSTIATKPGGSAASCAESAISASASSRTTSTGSTARSHTSERLEPWVVWCGLNDEQERLAEHFGDRCFSLTGSQSPDDKVDVLERWLVGERPVLVTKVSIAGFGINMQHCARMAFVGLSDSYEAYYQAIRRCYRYGQTREVEAHIVLSRIESEISANVQRKEISAAAFTAELVEAMRSHGTWRAA